MRDIFQNIRAVGFDLDGTFYVQTPEMDEEIVRIFAEKVLEKNPDLGSLEKAREVGEAKCKELESRTNALKFFGYENARDLMPEILKQADSAQFLKRDEKLVEVLNEIRKAKEYLYLITTAPSAEGRKKLEKLGVSEDIFDIILYGDHEVVYGKSKDENAFRFVIEKSGIPAGDHVYAGDREKADVLAPKSLGMKAIAVHKEIVAADAFARTIYEVRELIL